MVPLIINPIYTFYNIVGIYWIYHAFKGLQQGRLNSELGALKSTSSTRLSAEGDVVVIFPGSHSGPFKRKMFAPLKLSMK